MGVPTSEVGYTSATARRGDHESSDEHVVALEREKTTGKTIVLYITSSNHHSKLMLQRMITEVIILYETYVAKDDNGGDHPV